ncbi:glycine zipper 2TM domain-containing protein [Candidatus Williamhamiltonella defendens]|uniref:Uncharacterized protein n=1 Tax=Candidatus Hamiltonella defensa (Bemisia tabaci) TaxID=672795 RepID=A0A249DZ29_9ENTR|nr:glycine zipper 2TM domain-containing protein [Candidatus Hamiltonella defensa]ASX26796.1 hypothetical protein BA171_07240 [Candidatus Hamiltonella defensa (Bemisia tabaci)]CED79203.1 Outer membrane lipoprotein pcp [Candidatus Hamiltonella defensa (Bemisia tabaci)]
MLKPLFTVFILAITLIGCAGPGSLSGDVFSASEAKKVQNVSYGVIISIRPITIQKDGDRVPLGAIGGAVLGGLLGNTVGGGTGRTLATGAGAVAGGVAGQSAQNFLNKSKGVQLEIRKENNDIISVVQEQGSTQFFVNQRVMIASIGNSVTVSPHY